MTTNSSAITGAPGAAVTAANTGFNTTGGSVSFSGGATGTIETGGVLGGNRAVLHFVPGGSAQLLWLGPTAAAWNPRGRGSTSGFVKFSAIPDALLQFATIAQGAPTLQLAPDGHIEVWVLGAGSTVPVWRSDSPVVVDRWYRFELGNVQLYHYDQRATGGDQGSVGIWDARVHDAVTGATILEYQEPNAQMGTTITPSVVMAFGTTSGSYDGTVPVDVSFDLLQGSRDHPVAGTFPGPGAVNDRQGQDFDDYAEGVAPTSVFGSTGSYGQFWQINGDPTVLAAAAFDPGWDSAYYVPRGARYVGTNNRIGASRDEVYLSGVRGGCSAIIGFHDAANPPMSGTPLIQTGGRVNFGTTSNIRGGTGDELEITWLQPDGSTGFIPAGVAGLGVEILVRLALTSAVAVGVGSARLEAEVYVYYQDLWHQTLAVDQTIELGDTPVGGELLQYGLIGGAGTGNDGSGPTPQAVSVDYDFLAWDRRLLGSFPGFVPVGNYLIGLPDTEVTWSTGNIKVNLAADGAPEDWRAKPIKLHNPATDQWVRKPLKFYDGSTWQETPY